MSLHNLKSGGLNKQFADIGANGVECVNLSVSNAINVEDINIIGDITGVSLSNLSDCTVLTPLNGQTLVYDTVFGEFQNATVSGESTTASNLGTGEPIFAQKVGDDLQFRAIKAQSGSGISLNESADDIYIEMDKPTTERIDVQGVINYVNCVDSFVGDMLLSGIGDQKELSFSINITFTGGLPNIKSFEINLPDKSGNFIITSQAKGSCVIYPINNGVDNNNLGTGDVLGSVSIQSVIGSHRAKISFGVASVINTLFRVQGIIKYY